MALELVKLFAEIGGGNVPDYYACVCTAGEEDWSITEGGHEETFDEVAMAGQGLCLSAATQRDGVDGFVP